MAITLDQRFALDAPVDLVWSLLTDPLRIVGCLPGAAITACVDARTYDGTINLKVGPVTAAYKGRIRFERLDAATRQTEIVGQGLETKGKGSAEMRMRCRLQVAAPGRTEAQLTSELALTGILAQFGRGMLQQVADTMLQQFTAQMRRVLEHAKRNYAELVRAHAQQFAKLYADKLTELEAAAGFKIAADGSNAAASPADVVRYLEAVKKVGGEVSATSAKLAIRNLAQRENIAMPAL
jgi:carbon monoxide dehydrogenase subunit G